MSFDFATVAGQVNGWLTPKEGQFLYDQANLLKKTDSAVEIGSFLGRSTVCLASAHDKIYSIDPHIGSPKHLEPLGIADTFTGLQQNLKKRGLEGRVTLIKKMSNEALVDWPEPVSLAFVDGSHYYDDVKQDFENLIEKMTPGSVMAFHDSWHMSGVHWLTARVLLFSKRVSNPCLVDTITAFKIVTRNSFSQRLYNRLFVLGRLFWGFIGFLNLHYRGSRFV